MLELDIWCLLYITSMGRSGPWILGWRAGKTEHGPVLQVQLFSIQTLLQDYCSSSEDSRTRTFEAHRDLALTIQLHVLLVRTDNRIVSSHRKPWRPRGCRRSTKAGEQALIQLSFCQNDISKRTMEINNDCCALCATNVTKWMVGSRKLKAIHIFVLHIYKIPNVGWWILNYIINLFYLLKVNIHIHRKFLNN